MEDDAASQQALKFAPPSEGKSGLYIFRDTTLAGAIKKRLWVNGECVGETAPNVFFYVEVDGDKTHEVAIESEYSVNKKEIPVILGKHHYIRQYMIPGVFTGRANVTEIPEENGRNALAPLRLAKRWNCGEIPPDKK
jgi:hypothetical protein